ncbi:hypothetical protein ACG04R_23960 [Roseateles sp. BYS78W]|uniref:Uncharacterized protein n=1 Tax=Pelomonas candidula TaxID=3299025 RepID=A0ABW7HJA0_9BURK
MGFGPLLHLPEQAPVVTAAAFQPWPLCWGFLLEAVASNMDNCSDEPAGTSAGLRVDVELGGQVATYWVGRAGVSYAGGGPAAAAAFYLNAGRLLSDLRDIDALDSPIEGSLIDRVSRFGRMVAAEPGLEAAIGFANRDGNNGLVKLTCVASDASE